MKTKTKDLAVRKTNVCLSLDSVTASIRVGYGVLMMIILKNFKLFWVSCFIKQRNAYYIVE